jgi:hypothetical protein
MYLHTAKICLSSHSRRARKPTSAFPAISYPTPHIPLEFSHETSFKLQKRKDTAALPKPPAKATLERR